MQLKKIAGILLVLTGVFFFGDQIKAAAMSAYTPLVSIPGVGSPKNISQYLVGLYNFLLSIVGIVAVLMFIIGGFKYLTAAGNPSAATDAKDTIYNAAYGLILAIMSWVIVSTINPDVLVIKKPGGMTTGTCNPICQVAPSADDCALPAASTCNCLDGTTVMSSGIGTCDTDCKAAGKCNAKKNTCIKEGTSNGGDSNGQCSCIDGMKVPKGGALSCNNACLAANDCYFADFRVGMIAAWDAKAPSFGFTPQADIERAKYYAVNNTTKEHPLEFTEGCTFAVNAADFTYGSTPVTTYVVDFDMAGGFDDVPLVDGYFGLMACNIDPYAMLSVNPNCKTEIWSSAVVCPVNMEVTFAGGKILQATQYLKMTKP